MTAPQLIVVAALSAAVATLQLPVLPSPMLCAMAAVVFSLFCQRRYRLLIVIFGLVVSVALNAGRQWQDRLLPQRCERESVTLLGEVTGLVSRLSSERGAVYRFDLQTSGVTPAACTGPTRIRLYLHQSGQASHTAIPAPGDRLRVAARLRRPQGYLNPGAADGERQALLKGIHAVGSVSSGGIEVLGRSRLVGARVTRLRERLSVDLRRLVPGDLGGLAAALAVGDQRFITDDGWEQLRRFGLTHLMVISGLHITLLAAPGWWLGARLAGVKRRGRGNPKVCHLLPPVFALAPALVYAVLAGFSLPTQRALLVLGLAVVPRLCGRRVARGRLLAVCALLLFFLNPVSIIGASFGLSVSAVAMLLWFSVWRGATDESRLREATRVQILMLAAMLPMSLFWFQSGSGVGGLLNLVAIPLITLWVVPCLLLSLAPVLGNVAFADPLLQFGLWPLKILWRATSYWAAELQPLGIVDSAPTTTALLSAALAVIVITLPSFGWQKRTIVTLLAPLCLPLPSLTNENLKILVMDVGQGTSVLIQTESTSLLYDTGGGVAGGPPIAQRTVLPALRRKGVDTLDLLIISHPDLDHDAGEGLLRANLNVREVRRGRRQTDDGRACRIGERRRLGAGVELQFLSADLLGDSDNNASCVIAVHAYGKQLLLPGDIDSRRERDLLSYWGQELSADLLLAGHHGSASSNSRLWLRSLAPRLAIATVGRANRFGHPAERVKATADSLQVPLLTTADSGAITLTVFPDGHVTCMRLRHDRRAFWRRGAYSKNCLPR